MNIYFYAMLPYHHANKNHNRSELLPLVKILLVKSGLLEKTCNKNDIPIIKQLKHIPAAETYKHW